MITARSLLQNAILLLTRNPKKTVTVVAPALVLMLGVGILTALLAPDVLAANANTSDFSFLADGPVPLLLVAGFVLSYALMAILWHRHTLADRPARRPMSAMLVMGYLWRVLALALIQLVASLAIIMPLLIVTETGDGAARPPALVSILITTFTTQIILLWFSLRLSLILPAAALGKPMPLAHSWRHTDTIARPLWGVAAALALVNTGFTAITTFIQPTAPSYAVAVELPIHIIEGLLIFSVLTTLYSILVQKDGSSAA
ncbi:hypothetical protein ABMC88_11000 [Sulfitobacter sp. HNIBRBA2951]|uniref:hypothetical protein n=1 Tax=Sulfitobacter aquimarinus TaxID=3158557 RepID=UPI0032DF3E25